MAGSGKFKKGSNPNVKSFDDFVATCENNFGSSLAHFKRDRSADDEYLKKIKGNRGAVKSLGMNNPLTKSAIDYRVQMAVGTSVRIKPNVMWERLGWTEQENRDVRKSAKELWKMFMESDHRWSDAAGLQTISEQAAQHTRIFEGEGEAMATIFELGEARRSPLSFAIGNVNPARVRNPSDLSDELRLRTADGKLMSRRGYAQGFYVHDYVQGDMKANGEENYNFIPTRNRETGREQFIHSYVQLTSDLSRGISNLSSCLTLSCQKSDYVDAALEDAISKAGLTYVIKSGAQDIDQLMGVLNGVGSDQLPVKQFMEMSKWWHEQAGQIDHKGNRVARLLHGEELQGFDAPQAGGATFETFCNIIDTTAAACHGLSLEEYLQKWDKTNYSGARAGKVYVWNMINKLRAEAPWKFVRKAYCLFFEDMVLQGRIRLPNFGSDSFGAWQFFLANKEALTCVEFFGTPKDEIDRAKTADAYLAEGQLGVGTWESYCNEVLGVDWEDRLDQVIDEVKTTYDKLKNCGATPTWTIEEMVTHRLFAGNAFLARKELRNSGALDNNDEPATEVNE